ncbi:hypothetical protein [Streptomyces sp. TBY4]|uniref:hypothetical protein n=1 Tax=Streptomyces sp. TBY4 TaxID=2962030 RepID=UPI0020B7286E|nr:hypothetical protein [Streptomyces sp. TBY4]MCP3759201.1 hypothetical protein [Streptomyces sp. TBY4]
MRTRGHDLILLGFTDGAAPLAYLAETVTEALRRASAEQTGDAPPARRRHRQGSPGGPVRPHRDGIPEGGAPKKVELTIGDITDELGDEDFDAGATAAADPERLLIPRAQGPWLLDHLT